MYVDIHCHIIAGIDDGAKSEEVAFDMLKIAVQNGTRHIIATPHFISGSIHQKLPMVVEKCNDLQKFAQNQGIDLTMHSGCEVFISPDIPKLYESGDINTLSGSSYMLIELPMMSIPPYTDDVLYALQLKGIIPIIAHPERNSEIQKNPEILRDLVNRGILSQINSGSTTGLYGKKVNRTAIKLIKMRLVHFIASDAHTNRGRTPDLSEAAAIIEKTFGIQIMERLFIRNGMAVIQNGIVSSCPDVENISVQKILKEIVRRFKQYFIKNKGEA